MKGSERDLRSCEVTQVVTNKAPTGFEPMTSAIPVRFICSSLSYTLHVKGNYINSREKRITADVSSVLTFRQREFQFLRP